ncbi:MAG: hypothetical protein Q9195_006574 [Heterodermia aff. obscurata]
MKYTIFFLLLLTLLLQHAFHVEAPSIPILDGISAVEERWHAAAARLARQWRNPTDVLTILLIIGGDIVQKALAQLSGTYFVPVAFSFGWVSQSFNALLAAFGDGALMPLASTPSLLINVHSGYARLNFSWILNRILRGVEYNLEPLDAALCVSVFRSKAYYHGTGNDWLWWSGVITIILQLSIAVIPCAAQDDWTILLVTIIGICLALAGGCVPQWQKEKWGARTDNKNTTFCLTRGNGFQHVVVVQNLGPGCLNLEDLAMPRRDGCSTSCKVVVSLLALLWILFLINVAGLIHNTWYLLGVGLLGMAQNVSVAAFPRQPQAVGLPLELVERVQGPKVMQVLMNTERRFPTVGAALVNVFFPGKLRDDEQKFWAANAKERLPGSQPLITPLAIVRPGVAVVASATSPPDRVARRLTT